MAALDPINFAPIGLSFILRPTVRSANLVRNLNDEYIRHCDTMGPNAIVISPGSPRELSAHVIDRLGNGSYGTVELAIMKRPASQSSLVAMKKFTMPHRYVGHQARRNAWFNEIIRETIVQMTIHHTCVVAGVTPIVPEIYQICWNANTIFVIEERIPLTLHQYIDNNIDPKTGTFSTPALASILASIAAQLQFLQTRLQFNHRDMKTDNIMLEQVTTRRPPVTIHPGGPDVPQIPAFGLRTFIIDFGLSCLNYGKAHISAGEGIFSPADTCFKPGRDLAQLLVSFYLLHRILTQDFLDYLRTALTVVTAAGIECIIPEDCDIFGMRNWEDTYAFLDRPNLPEPRTTPEAVLVAVIPLIKGRPRARSRPRTGSRGRH